MATANLICLTCSTPFRRTHSRQIYCGPACRQDEHPKVTLVCEACNGPAIKDRGSRRYPRVFCSNLCRDYALWGGQSCKIPRDHMARWVGKSCEWAPPLIRNTGSCVWCGHPNDRSRAAKFCSPLCKRSQKRANRRAREHNASGTYTWTMIVKLWNAFDRQCAYCTQPTDLTTIQAEHVIALSRGGSNGLANLLPSCPQCNSDKRDLMLVDWNTDRARRGLPARVTTWDETDSRYKHLARGQSLAA